MADGKSLEVGTVIDISVPLYQGMVHWPGDPSLQIEYALSMERGDPCNVSKLSMGAHTGTHMDAPLHFIANGASLDQMPLTATIGPARVIHINDPVSITVAELQQHNIEPGERLLFQTRNSDDAWQSSEFAKDFVALTHEAAQYLAACQVQTVGVDYLSVGGFEKDGTETHLALLGAGIWVIEGLNLGGVQPGTYQLICLPLKLIGREGGPARAVLQVI